MDDTGELEEHRLPEQTKIVQAIDREDKPSTIESKMLGVHMR